MDTVVDRIGFAIREGRRYEDGGMAWNVCLQGQGEIGLYSAQFLRTKVSHPIVSRLSVTPEEATKIQTGKEESGFISKPTLLLDKTGQY